MWFNRIQPTGTSCENPPHQAGGQHGDSPAPCSFPQGVPQHHVPSSGPTSTRSKAEGVPPRCTWPRTVTRVSKPKRFTTSCGAEGVSHWGPTGHRRGRTAGWGGAYVLHVVGGDGFATAVDGALGDDDDVEARPSAARLVREEENSHWGSAKTHPESFPCLRGAQGLSPQAGAAPGVPGLDLCSAERPVSQGQWPELPKLHGGRVVVVGLSWVPAGTPQGQNGDRTLGNPPLTSPSLSHIRSSQPSSGGDSGMKSQSAPEAKPDTSARYLGTQ